MSTTSTISDQLDQIQQTINTQTMVPQIDPTSFKEFPFNEQLSSSYEIEDQNAPARRATITLFNHIAARNLNVLPVSRSIISKLHDTDPNWKTKKPFLDSDYKTFLNVIRAYGIRKITRYSNYKASLFFVDERCPAHQYLSGDNSTQLRDTFALYEISKDNFVDITTFEEFKKHLSSGRLLN